MSRVVQGLEINMDQTLEEVLAWKFPNHGEFRILKKSVDARRRHDVRWVYSLEIADPGESLKAHEFIVPRTSKPPDLTPIIVGAGPAGLFAALRFVERGIPCRLIEQGSIAQKRINGINQFWRYGRLDSKNNVCFGEGGAGLYSDGKLITRIKSPEIPYIMNRLVKFGAPREIEYLSNPHVGSDRIRRVIPHLRQFLIESDCEIHFDEELTQIEFTNNSVQGIQTHSGKKFATNHLILATGHSSEKVFQMLSALHVQMEGKSFAVGLRVEHPQSEINQIQYRQHAEHPALGAANYRLTHHDPTTGIGVYSFCMCPGGYVLSSGTEADGLVSNGMSNYRRNSPFANSAVVVSVDHNMNFERDLFGGLKFRKKLEQAAFESVKNKGGTKELPAQTLISFLEAQSGPQNLRAGSSPSGAIASDLHAILPSDIFERLREGFLKFNRTMKGFLSKEALVYGVETRTSCPVRVTRDETTLESVSHRGLYPCGEGAGYAGGITSAACDGIRCAEAVLRSVDPQTEPTPWAAEISR